MFKPTAVIPPAERVALTYAQAGQLLGVSPRTIWRMVREGDLRPIRVRRSTRITRAEIERYTIAQEAAAHGLGPQPSTRKRAVA